MWIASTMGWFSVVKNNEIKGREVHVLVRARFKDQYTITRPTADEARDYRWRVSIKRKDWSKILAISGRTLLELHELDNFNTFVSSPPLDENEPTLSNASGQHRFARRATSVLLLLIGKRSVTCHLSCALPSF